MPSELIAQKAGKDTYGKDGFSLHHWMTLIHGAAIRYVERNPVRAGMVKHAEEYAWSSAAAHCGIKTANLLKLTTGDTIAKSDWSSWLAVEENEEALQILRRNVEKGLPCGSDNFIEKLEKYSNKSLKYRPQGRPFADKG